MSPLTSKERVLIALRHEEPDRVPIDFGARHSVHVSAHRALKRHLGLEDGADTIRSYLNNSAEPDPRLVARFATDVIAFPVGSGSRYSFRLDPGTNSYADEWGITMRMPPGGYYYDPVGYPLATVQTVAEVERYPFPDPTDPHRLAGILQPIRIASTARDKAILLNAPTVGIWWLAFYLRGLEQAMVDLGLQPELTEVSGAADATPASSSTGLPPRCGMKSGAAWRTWRPGAASSSAPSTTSRSTCPRQTSWPCSTRRETRVATAAAGPSPDLRLAVTRD